MILVRSYELKLKSGFWVIKQDSEVAFQGVFNEGFAHSLLDKDGNSRDVVTTLSVISNNSFIDIGVLSSTNNNSLDIHAKVNSETSVENVSQNGSTYLFEYDVTASADKDSVSTALQNTSYVAKGTSQARLELDAAGNFTMITSQIGDFDTCTFTGLPLTIIDEVSAIATDYTCLSSITGTKTGSIHTNWLAGSWDIGTLQGDQLIVEIPSSSEELYQDTSFHFHLVTE